MFEKAFRASRFDDAMAKVKRELGPDAVIVSTRQLGQRDGRMPEIEVRGASLPRRGAARLRRERVRGARESICPVAGAQRCAE